MDPFKLRNLGGGRYEVRSRADDYLIGWVIRRPGGAWSDDVPGVERDGDHMHATREAAAHTVWAKTHGGTRFYGGSAYS